MFQFSKKSIDRMQGVNPDLILIFCDAIKNSPIDFGIPDSGGLRTAGQQNLLYQSKVSKCDGITSKSKHQAGDALDFYAYVNGKASWNKVHLAMVAGCILSTASRLKKEGRVSCDLVWGGSFNSDNFHGWDLPHFEIA